MIFRRGQDDRGCIFYFLLQSFRTFGVRVGAWEREMIVGRINNMLKDLWTASEKPAFEFADRVQLRQVVTDSVEQLKNSFAAKDIQVENTIPDSLPELHVKFVGTKPIAKVHVVKDNKYVYTAEPKTVRVNFSWKDTAPQSGKTSYYYVRGEQEDGEIVWASPMWITYK